MACFKVRPAIPEFDLEELRKTTKPSVVGLPIGIKGPDRPNGTNITGKELVYKCVQT